MGMIDIDAINTERVTDAVYRVLRESIVSRSLPPGSKINVEELAKRFEVSRTPVHEALTMLSSDGLVEIQPRRGTFVTEFTAREYEETLDIRRALELLACEGACMRATDGDIQALESLMNEMADSVRNVSDPREAARLHDMKNLEFHQRLVRLSGNMRLIDLYEDLRAHLRIARAHLDATGWRERVPIEASEHLEIIQALRDRDVEAMKSALDTHLRRSSASLIEDVQRAEGRAEATRSE